MWWERRKERKRNWDERESERRGNKEKVGWDRYWEEWESEGREKEKREKKGEKIKERKIEETESGMREIVRERELGWERT